MRCDLGHFLPHLPEKMVGQLPDDSWLRWYWVYTCKRCKQSKFKFCRDASRPTIDVYISLDRKYVDFEPNSWINTVALPRCDKGHFCKTAEDTETRDNETIRNLTDWYCNYCKKGKLIYDAEYTVFDAEKRGGITDFCIEIDDDGTVTDSYFDLWGGFK